MRLFFAVDFSDRVKNVIRRAIEDMGIDDPPWRWVATQNLHMTLKFLGDAPGWPLDRLGGCAAKVAAKTAPFSIRLGRLGAFPSFSRPRVLFFRVEDGAATLENLARHLDAALAESLGIPRETRPFRAHATIARLKQPLPPALAARLRDAPAFEGVSQTVDRLALVESRLHPQGARYHHVKEFALAKP